MMTTAMEKGTALENAVRAIETAILNSSPALRENTFKIESKKIIVIDGVRHEIDIYVEVDMGQGYKAIFIFECKNWKDAVGKNEIIVFAEKIDALQAQKGFFVAKSFTTDADAQARKDRRIDMLLAKEHNAADTPVPFKFHHIIVYPEKSVSEIEVIERGANPEKAMIPIDIKTAAVPLRGAEIDFQKYVEEWLSQTADNNLKFFNSTELPDGIYERDANDERTFENNELVLNGSEIQTIKLRIRFPVQVVQAKIVSHFEVATRGRTISFAHVKVGDASLQAAFVSRLQNDSRT